MNNLLVYVYSSLNPESLILNPAIMSGYFITGTDTGVGKTIVACALLHAFASRGHRVVGMKPVAAGLEEGRNLDVEMLLSASSATPPRELANPYSLERALAPHIAARQAGVAISLDAVERAFARLRDYADVIIVEGVGGFKVPLNDTEDSADLAARLALPVILVVGMRLGCLNHALLTAQAVRGKGLSVAGWVANRIDSGMPAFEDNVQALQQRLGAPLLAVVPYLERPDPRAIAALLGLGGLR